MADKLSIYNGALREVGERRLVDLTENREPRHDLDSVWDGGGVQYCLEQGFWHFAMRSQKIEYSPSIEPQFGYRFAFTKSDDYIRTAAVCSDEYFNCPVTQYADEIGYWFSDMNPLYVKFVSNDVDYGFNLSGWPATFNLYVELYFAHRIAPRTLKNQTREDKLEKKMDKALVNARSKDAMNQPASFKPPGRWTRARMGGRTVDRNRTGNTLYG